MVNSVGKKGRQGGQAVAAYRSSTVTALTHISPNNTPGGDDGDIYTGLDRFGRVVDQKWTNTATTFDEFQYSYDPDGNARYRDRLFG